LTTFDGTVIKAPYGPEEIIKETFISCPDCGAEIDDTSDDTINIAFAKSKEKSIINIIDYLENSGYTKARIERVFGLQRGSISSSGDDPVSALLCLIRAFPWLVEIAENNYDSRYIAGTIFREFSEILKKIKGETL